MQNFRNYYEILGLNGSASADEIKQAYRRLARKYHPDLNPGDKAAEEKFKDLGEAYEMLSDPVRRSQYDSFSQYWKQPGFQKSQGRNGSGTPTQTNRSTEVRSGSSASGSSADKSGSGKSGSGSSPSGSSTSSTNGDFSQFRDFNSFVDQLLGRRSGREGGTATATRPTAQRSKSSSSSTQTSPSRLRAQSRTTQRDAEAHLVVPLQKAYAGGQERIRLEDGRSLEVNMPVGILSGQRVRLRGQGVNGGDLYLKVEVAPHAFFQLEGTDVVCHVPITPSEAALGAVIEVPTLDGRVKMTIPPGVRSAQRLRLAGKGYPAGNGKRGDQIVEVQITVPKELSSQERELYEKLQRVEIFNPRANLY